MSDLSTKVEKWINSHLDKKILDLGIEKYQVVPILNDPFIGKPIWVIKYKQSTIIFSDKKWVSDFENLIEHYRQKMHVNLH